MLKKTSKLLLLSYFGLWIGYFAYFWSQAFALNSTGDIVTNHANIWADWAAHFTLGSNMAFDQLITTQSPFLFGKIFAYPFITDLISALLIKAGIPFLSAFVFPSFILSLLIIWALYFFYQTLFKSRLTAIIASLLFLFNGGLGFIYYIQDILNSETPWITTLNPPRQYTNLEPFFYRWLSVIDSMIIPQRAFTLGFPLTLLVLTSFLRIFFGQEKNRFHKLLLVWSGLVLGLMPLIHTHSFLAAFIILSIWAGGDVIIKKSKSHVITWVLLAIGVSLIALPIIKIFFADQVSSNFIKWFPGWYSHEDPQQNWLIFWLKNWGVLPLLALLGLIKLYRQNRKNSLNSLIIFVPFFIIFILANLFLFQPYIWDNTKLIVWSSVGFSGLGAYFLIFTWQQITQLQKSQNQGTHKKNVLKFWQKNKYLLQLLKFFIFLLFFCSIFAGAIDAYRLNRPKLHSYIMYTAEELTLADWVKNNTAPNSIWLTGDKHNHWLYNLTGRQTLMTYRGWLWTHGYGYQLIEKDLAQMFQYPSLSKNLFQKYGVNYVVIGPDEKNNWRANETEFKNFPIIKTSPNYTLYSLISP